MMTSCGGAVDRAPSEPTSSAFGLVFRAADCDGTVGLWATSGSGYVAPLAGGFTGGTPQLLTAVDGDVYFVATHANLPGLHLWKTDGTQSGTAPVGGVCPTSGCAQLSIRSGWRCSRRLSSQSAAEMSQTSSPSGAYWA